MEFLFSYWYMFAACVVIATIAMAAGIGGATFYVPFLLLVLKVPIESAIAIGIFVEIFGFSAGVYNYTVSHQIDFGLAKKIILSSFLFVILGVNLNHSFPPSIVEYIFILALMIFATQLLLYKGGSKTRASKFDFVSMIISALGGFLLGFVSSGMGEANEYNFFTRLRLKPSKAAGTSVAIVAVNAVIATATQVYFFLQRSSFGTISPYYMLITYSVLGSFVGAKLGSVITQRIDREQFRKFISILLYFVALVSLAKVLLIKN